MKIYTRKRDLYKQIKLAKILEFKLKTERNFKATTNFFNFLSFKKKEKKKRKEKKSYNKSAKLHFYYSTEKYDNSITSVATYFSFSKRQFPPKLIAVLHNAC